MPTIRGLPIPIFTMEEQDIIAQVLGALDDKIELNRRMNETLEALAWAIFKDWFVDFGPTRAKAEGREPYLPAAIWDLFPDNLDGDMKPVGWEFARLGNILGQRIERCSPSPETASRPYVPIDCISPRSLFLSQSKPGEEAKSSLTRFYKGDLLFGAMRPYFHKVCIAPFDGTTRTTVFVLIPNHEKDFSFSTMLLHDPETIDYAARHSTGSTIPYAVWCGSLEDMPITLPPPRLRGAFDDIVRPLLDKIPPTFFESRSLAQTRDLLLPKLMSGEIRLRDAAKVVEEAA